MPHHGFRCPMIPVSAGSSSHRYCSASLRFATACCQRHLWSEWFQNHPQAIIWQYQHCRRQRRDKAFAIALPQKDRFSSPIPAPSHCHRESQHQRLAWELCSSATNPAKQLIYESADNGYTRLQNPVHEIAPQVSPLHHRKATGSLPPYRHPVGRRNLTLSNLLYSAAIHLRRIVKTVPHNQRTNNFPFPAKIHISAVHNLTHTSAGCCRSGPHNSHRSRFSASVPETMDEGLSAIRIGLGL